MQFPSIAKAIEDEELHRAIIGAGRERMLREICDGLEAFTKISMKTMFETKVPPAPREVRSEHDQCYNAGL